MTNDLFGAIEGGGTKFVCAVGKADGSILAETRFPTTTPDETLGRAIQFFRAQSTTLGKLSSLGIACFGPLDPNPSSPLMGTPSQPPSLAGAASMSSDVCKLHSGSLSVSIPM